MLIQNFRDFDEMYVQAIDDVIRYGNGTGSRVQPMLEMLMWAGQVNAAEVYLLCNKRRHMNPCYAWAEVLWYLHGTTSTKAIVPYAPQYTKWAPNGIAEGYNYGERIQHPIDQLRSAITLMRDKPDTRRASLMIAQPVDVMNSLRDDYNAPCGLSWSFYPREDTLNMMAVVRSQDLWLGMPYDVFANCQLLKIIAQSLGLQPGTYTHVVGSLHIYERYHERCLEARVADCYDSPYPPRAEECDELEFAAMALKVEEQLRKGQLKSLRDMRLQASYNVLGPLFKTACRSVAAHWMPPEEVLEDGSLELELCNANCRRV